MKSISHLFTSFYGVAATIGVVVPFILFFTQNAPPLFSEISFITAALALALLVSGIRKQDASTTDSYAFELLVLAFILFLAYLFLMHYTTLRVQHNIRWQLGFGLQNWSLTPEALQLMREGTCPGKTNEAMLLCTGMKKDHISMIWKQWTVYAAGLAIIVTFTLSILVWTQAWLILARNHITNSTKS